jgi:hypothetical protein
VCVNREFVDHDGVRFRSGRDAGKLFGPQVRRTQDHAPRDAVKFDQCEGGRQLIARRDQYRTAAQRFELRKNGAFGKLGECGGGAAPVKFTGECRSRRSDGIP